MRYTDCPDYPCADRGE